MFLTWSSPLIHDPTPLLVVCLPCMLCVFFETILLPWRGKLVSPTKRHSRCYGINKAQVGACDGGCGAVERAERRAARAQRPQG